MSPHCFHEVLICNATYPILHCGLAQYDAKSYEKDREERIVAVMRALETIETSAVLLYLLICGKLKANI